MAEVLDAEAPDARPGDIVPGRAAVVYNPLKIDLDALRAAVAAEVPAGWAETLWLETTQDDPGSGQVREALRAGATLVIAAGGDGTIRATAEAIAGSGVPLALIAAGTGNLLARNLDLLTGDIPHAVRTAFTGVDARIDLARLEIHRPGGAREAAAFVVMAGFGLDAKMLANTDDDLKRRVGWLAYVDAIRKALRDKNRLRMTYRTERRTTRSVSAHTLIVGNCGALPANILLLPNAAVDDGRFEAVFLRPESIRGWMQIVFKIFWENGVVRRTRLGRAMLTPDVAALRYVVGRELQVRLSRPEELELDGDGFGSATGFDLRIDAGGLTVRVPEGSRPPATPAADEPRRRRVAVGVAVVVAVVGTLTAVGIARRSRRR
jgi:diacylglycerol kinase family enzyme